MRGDHVDPLGDGQAGGRGGDDEGRQPARAVVAGAREQGHDIGDRAVADVGLVAVDDPFVAIANRAALHPRGVAAALGFGHREGGDRTPPGDSGKPVGALLVVAEEADRARSEALHGKGKIGDP